MSPAMSANAASAILESREREITLRANTADFEPLRFAPRVLTDASQTDTGTTLLGEQIALPLLIAPMGLCGLVRPQGELALARAAHFIFENIGTEINVGHCS